MRHGGRGGPVERYFSAGEITLHQEVEHPIVVVEEGEALW